jgi:hypothetical protein
MSVDVEDRSTLLVKLCTSNWQSERDTSNAATLAVLLFWMKL